jgi:hypothetical protein
MKQFFSGKRKTLKQEEANYALRQLELNRATRAFWGWVLWSFKMSAWGICNATISTRSPGEMAARKATGWRVRLYGGLYCLGPLTDQSSGSKVFSPCTGAAVSVLLGVVVSRWTVVVLWYGQTGSVTHRGKRETKQRYNSRGWREEGGSLDLTWGRCLLAYFLPTFSARARALVAFASLIDIPSRKRRLRLLLFVTTGQPTTSHHEFTRCSPVQGSERNDPYRPIPGRESRWRASLDVSIGR